jgi:hypothetical protein
MSFTNPTPADHFRWICNTSAEEGRDEIKRLLADPAQTPETLGAILASAREYEEANSKRTSLLAGIAAAQKQLAKRSSGTIPGQAEIEKYERSMSNPTTLQACSEALAALRETIAVQEEKFAAITLQPRLFIGLECLKAFQVFSLQDPGKRGQGRKKNQLTRELISTPGGFGGWLATENPWLKEPTAYKYMEAVTALGLDHSATRQAISASLDILAVAGPVTLKSLIDRAPYRLALKDAPPVPQQTEFEFIRENLSALRVEVDNVIRLKDQLLLIPDAHRAACARAYGLLRELTGTDWSPSDLPDALADVDPDTLTL